MPSTNNEKKNQNEPNKSITEHPDQKKHESREKMEKDKETEPMNPMKTNRANPENWRKKGAKSIPDRTTNWTSKPTQENGQTPAQIDPKPSHKPPSSPARAGLKKQTE